MPFRHWNAAVPLQAPLKGRESATIEDLSEERILSGGLHAFHTNHASFYCDYFRTARVSITPLMSAMRPQLYLISAPVSWMQFLFLQLLWLHSFIQMGWFWELALPAGQSESGIFVREQMWPISTIIRAQWLDSHFRKTDIILLAPLATILCRCGIFVNWRPSKPSTCPKDTRYDFQSGVRFSSDRKINSFFRL